MTTRVHLDTDIGGDPDDLCALALLLAEPEVEIVGITTCAAGDGTRAALVRHALALVGRTDIPVASGAFGFLGGVPHTPETQDERYWPGAARLHDSPPGAAVDLIIRNAAAGATIVGIGPYTNLAIAEALRPGTLASTRVVLMGGHLGPIPAGLPQWGPDVDYNVQADRVAARIVFESSNPLVVPVNVTVQAWLRGADLPALRSGGPLAQLMAIQAELQGNERWIRSLVRTNDGLPRDLLNFHHDPLAVAAALGWGGMDVADASLHVTFEGEQLVLRDGPGGWPARVLTAVDGPAFAARWLERVQAL